MATNEEIRIRIKHPGRPMAEARKAEAATRQIETAYRDSEQARERLLAAVVEARKVGASWAVIGEAMDMSRQAAWERFGRFADAALAN